MSSIITLILFLITIVLFIVNPSIDIHFSNLFFDVNTMSFGSAFFIKHIHFFAIFYGIGTFCYLVFAAVPKVNKSALYYRKILYVALVILVGHFMFSTLLKTTVARSRPMHTEVFGGTAKFTGPFAIGQCKKECSFTSTHSSIGFITYAFALIADSIFNRRILFVFATVLGLSFGFSRIITGHHFLSDVIFAGWFMYFISVALYKILLAPVKAKDQDVT